MPPLARPTRGEEGWGPVGGAIRALLFPLMWYWRPAALWMSRWRGTAGPGAGAEEESSGGFAVRAEWPDGTHTLEALRAELDQAERQAQKMRGRAVASRVLARVRVVAVSREEWNRHRDRRPCLDPRGP